MRGMIIPIALLLATTLSAQRLFVDAVNSQIDFEFPHRGVKGTIGGLQTWTTDLDLHDLSNSYVSGSVAIETLRTKNFFRDKLWQRKELFYKKEFPRIHFKSTSIVKKENSFVVVGNLKIKDASKRISLEFTKQDDKLLGVTSVNLQDFDISPFKKRMDNRVNVSFELQIHNSGSSSKL